jgi:cytoskeletal protein CcmA (bactofilin family)
MAGELQQRSWTLDAGVKLTGGLTAAEDIVIAGHVEGDIALPAHHLTIAAAAVVHAKIVARSVTISGSVEGTIVAEQRVHVLATASVRGHLTTPSILLDEAARFTGTIDPNRTDAAMRVARYRERQRSEQV